MDSKNIAAEEQEKETGRERLWNWNEQEKSYASFTEFWNAGEKHVF